MGRPTKGNKPMNERITFYLSKDLFDALQEARFDLRLERSDLIREAILDFLDKKLPKDVKTRAPYQKALKENEK